MHADWPDRWPTFGYICQQGPVHLKIPCPLSRELTSGEHEPWMFLGHEAVWPLANTRNVGT